MKDDAFRGLSRLLVALENAAEKGLSVGSVRALLWIAALTANPYRPYLPNVSGIAGAIGVTPSGASRVLNALIKDGLIIGNRSARSARSGAFILSKQGWALIADILNKSGLSDEKDFDVPDFETLEETMAVEKDTNKLIIIDQIEDNGHTILRFVHPSDTHRQSINEWCAINLSDGRQIEKKIISEIRFINEAELVQFLFTWPTFSVETSAAGNK